MDLEYPCHNYYIGMLVVHAIQLEMMVWSAHEQVDWVAFQIYWRDTCSTTTVGVSF